MSPRSSLAVAFVLALATGCGAGSGYAPAKEPMGDRYRYYAAAPMQMAYPGAPPSEEAPVAQPAPEAQGTEGFKDHGVNPFVDAKKDRLSTFSIDVDTASYSFGRRKLVRENTLPPYASVRAEEYLNSFDYGYETPSANDKAPFKVHFAASPSPFTQGHHLVRIGVQAKRVTAQERMPVHLVYLVDTSGSMSPADRLPLAKKSLALLTETLKPGDTVALCTYAGDTKVVLEPTGVDDKQKILAAIASLGAGGGTAMSSGIDAAYALASRTLVKGHVNRIVVLSDGDANIGRSSHEEILKTIAQYKDKGITLSTVGFGSGNYKDTMMEQLADKGDGNYTYIDGEDEARKVFTEQVDGLLQVVARDVKIQVEYDPNVVKRYRLIGYENRDIADKDFRNDKVDAGEVGAGHSVTALYDVELVDPAKAAAAPPLTLRMRWKPAKNALHGGGDQASEETFKMPASAIAPSFEEAPESYRFAVAVGAFAEVLRRSPHAADWSLDKIGAIASNATASRKDRTELVSLVDRAARLSAKAR
ncbi:MAG: von Willebrand factor type A domain-containing protein [Labilithrix sp.]|nr:von Willebrand factor type A domain-containing protein [Labilithrix sp.]MCW5811794.1 von Willebrand factor type A domain-containing protein [Labilithrix sp.]